MKDTLVSNSVIALEQRTVVQEMGRDIWDVIVIGAGPAGGVAATLLADNGHRVLLLDAEHFPRRKVCGDGIITDALRILDSIGLSEEVRAAGRSWDLATVYSPSRIEVQIPGVYVTLKRAILDSLIVRRACAAGTTFALGKVRQVQWEQGGPVTISFADSNAHVQAKVAILATGARLDLPRKLGMTDHTQPTAVAIQCYVRSSYRIERLVGSYDRSILPGYGWIFPMGNGEYNVGTIVFLKEIKAKRTNVRKAFHRFTSQFPLAQHLFRNGEMLTPLCSAPLQCSLNGTRPLADGPVIATGETLGTTLPFTAEGIGKAMVSAKLAAKVVHEALRTEDISHLQNYSETLDRELRPVYRDYKIAQRWLSISWINDMIARRANSDRSFHKAIIGIIAETENPTKAISLRGLLRSYWESL